MVDTSPESQNPAPPQSGASLSLENLAEELAGQHKLTADGRQRPVLLDQLRENERTLAQAYRHFATAPRAELALSYAAEWILDNYYLVQQAIREIRQDLPRGYYGELPKLGDPEHEVYPRVYALAAVLIRFSNSDLALTQIERFVQAYDRVSPLTMGELWALPTMLRLGIVERLAAAVNRILEPKPQDGDGQAEPGPAMASQESIIANGITSLRTLGATDWNNFFESVSRVERVLRQDPSGVYPCMDFETRDRYRKVVEGLARAVRQSEEQTAQAAIALALEAMPAAVLPGMRADAPRAAHVGFYLLDKGRAQLEREVGYQPNVWVRLKRWARSHAFLVYTGGILALALPVWLVALVYVALSGGTPAQLVVAAVLVAIPAVALGVNVVNWVVTRLVPPDVLPKMDFKDGVPAEYRTMLVVPALLTGPAEVKSLIGQLERHFLSNPDGHLGYALLSDWGDAPSEKMPGDEALLEQAQAGIRALNARYGTPGYQPFYLFHRRRMWNPAEKLWIGWERKRGKLAEFDRLLRGERDTSYVAQEGNLDILAQVRYVITLDADTILPRQGAHRLVGTLAHPLNQAEFDDEDRVTAGYTLLQPRIDITPASANTSLFARIFAGDTGLDLYTRAVSDVYQDLFHEGIYVGKGIYDVDAFERSLRGRVPENALLSHDLFEGAHGRAALVTDIIVLEDYPPRYLPYMRRVHRWVRGDWQLLPWLFPSVPGEGGQRIPNRLSGLDRWKIVDNLRRSLTSPALLALLVAGWLGLPGSAWVWTLAAILVPAVPLLTEIVNRLVNLPKGADLRSLSPGRYEVLRWLLALVFLPYDAVVSLDAIATTLVRVWITRRELLQWTTAAHTNRLFGQDVAPNVSWSQMASTFFFSVALGALVLLIHPAAAWAAALLLLAWLVSPEIAYLISRPIPDERTPLDETQRQQLARLARRTWLFFEQFVGPEDNWLPPDHYQEAPRGVVAHRTSPTNIGLLMLVNLSAYDRGYIGSLDLALRLSSLFDSLGKMERYRGHFLNWYDTRSLQPLLPRYVSTVDSGNLAASLIALRQACFSIGQDPVMRETRWQGLRDTLDLLSEAVQELPAGPAKALQPLQAHLAAMRRQASEIEGRLDLWSGTLNRLYTDEWHKLDELLVLAVESDPQALHPAALKTLRLYAERVSHHLFSMRRRLIRLMPWLPAMDATPELFSRPGLDPALADAWQALTTNLSGMPRLADLPDVCRVVETHLKQLEDVLARQPGSPEVDEARNWSEHLRDRLSFATMAARTTMISYQNLAARADALVREMDYSFLLDQHRQLFHIGYNLDAGALDPNYYDLLASESRMASLIAIAKGDVPASHWMHLGRPVAPVDGRSALVSWSGTSFEYLMPDLLVPSYERTLLGQTGRAVVQRQIEYGREKAVPWGISESGYYRFDNNMNYQYRAFGTPGLGFKRGLGDDEVITPYASLLALSLRPGAVMDNIARLREQGMLGPYGFYEAIDYTKQRLPLGRNSMIVYSYMAHHQGMILLSLVNYLDDDIMVRRFHADPRMQTVDLLLQEQIPQTAPSDQAAVEETHNIRPERPLIAIAPWRVPVDSPVPQAHVLSNGRYSVVVTNSGGGFSAWGDVDLTRWRADTTLDDWGSWVYIQDQDTGEFWSLGYQPAVVPGESQDVFFTGHMAEFRRHAHDILARMEVGVAPEDDVEIRRISLVNHANRTRRLRLVSYAEVILAPQLVDARHPAFNKMFVESEYQPDVNALVFHRRPRSSEEEPLYMAHRLVPPSGEKATGECESDRRAFLGRTGSPRWPLALTDSHSLTGTTGATLDPIMALGQNVTLKPHQSVELAYLTMAGPSRQKVLSLAEQYSAWPAIGRAFDQARRQSEIELRQLGLDGPELERIEYLLSALLYPSAALRSTPETLAANSKGQPGLWAYGISGDYPILLARISSSTEIPLVSELFQAHAYWRSRQRKITLVILNMIDSGYNQELNDQLVRLAVQTGNDVWLNRHDGIFILRAAQMPEADRTLLQTAARAVLDGKEGALAHQIGPLFEGASRLPLLAPTLGRIEDVEPTPSLARPTGLVFDNGLGGFSSDGREYLVYLEPGQQTPAPWINVIANPDLGFLVSEAGSGYTWAFNSGENRLTPWRNDPVRDMPAEAVYIRDEETAQSWSPTPLPAPAPAPYLVRHGAGYSTFEHISHGLRQQTRFFAAPDAPVKIVQLKLENLWSRPRRITVTYYAEWVLGTTREDMQPFVVPEFEPESQAVLASNRYNVEFVDRVAFLAANKPLHGLTCDRAEFLGRLGSYDRPAALDRVGLAFTVKPGLDPCAAIQLHVDLAPGQSETVYFLLGQGASREESLRLIGKFKDPGQVEAAWQGLDQFWADLLGTIEVQTPDPALDLMLNRWLLYQALSCRIWGRSALYQSSGAFGYRDQLQDVMSLAAVRPELTREHILESARHQFEAGDVLHWWHPPSGRGVRTRCSDDLLWLPFVTAHYVVTTGDRSILEEKVPFLKGDPLRPDELERYAQYEPTAESYSLYEHCRRAIKKGSTGGRHGIPLMGTGDWNDGLNRVGVQGRGESVWVGWFLYATLDRFSQIAEMTEDRAQAVQYRDQASMLRQALDLNTWDGNWYCRAYYDDGSPLGSAQNHECQIDSIAQSWAVLSGAGEAQRSAQAMQSVLDRLVRPDDRVVLLFTPPFDRTARDPGYIKGYPPGVRENGGQYTHAALWAAWGFAGLGQGDRAYDLFRILNPVGHAGTSSSAVGYRVEPYVVTADVYSVAPYVGRGGWSWYTGSASWMYRLGVEGILGLRRAGDSLQVDPCIPPGWREYQLSYRDGETRYHIRVANPAGVSRGVKRVTLDDKTLPDRAIPLLKDGQEHEVLVEMGRAE